MSVQKGSNIKTKPRPDNLPKAEHSLHSRSEAQVDHVHYARQGAHLFSKDYEVVFPALAPSDSSAGASTPVLAAPSTTLIFLDSFFIENIDLSRANKNGAPKTLSDIMNDIMLQNRNVTLEASTHRQDGHARASFVIKAGTEYDLEDARRKLSVALNTVITCVVQAPASAVGTIIGRKGEDLLCLLFCAKCAIWG